MKNTKKIISLVDVYKRQVSALVMVNRRDGTGMILLAF